MFFVLSSDEMRILVFLVFSVLTSPTSVLTTPVPIPIPSPQILGPLSAAQAASQAASPTPPAPAAQGSENVPRNSNDLLNKAALLALLGTGIYYRKQMSGETEEIKATQQSQKEKITEIESENAHLKGKIGKLEEAASQLGASRNRHGNRITGIEAEGEKTREKLARMEGMFRMPEAYGVL